MWWTFVLGLTLTELLVTWYWKIELKKRFVFFSALLFLLPKHLLNLSLSSPFPDPPSLSHIICQRHYHKTSSVLPFPPLFPLRAPIHLLPTEIYLKIKQGLVMLGAQDYSSGIRFKILEMTLRVIHKCKNLFPSPGPLHWPFLTLPLFTPTLSSYLSLNINPQEGLLF